MSRVSPRSSGTHCSSKRTRYRGTLLAPLAPLFPTQESQSEKGFVSFPDGGLERHIQASLFSRQSACDVRGYWPTECALTSQEGDTEVVLVNRCSGVCDRPSCPPVELTSISIGLDGGITHDCH